MLQSSCDIYFESNHFFYRQYERSQKEENNILWLGRIAKEKQPLDVVYAMEHIVKEFPDIRLHMVGDGDEKLTEMLKNLICQLGLQDNVILEGFTSEVEKYYEKHSF